MICSTEQTKDVFCHKMECSCGEDNYVDAGLPEIEDWHCWSCKEYMATIIGLNQVKSANRSPHPVWTRIYRLPPVEERISLRESE